MEIKFDRGAEDEDEFGACVGALNDSQTRTLRIHFWIIHRE